MLIVHFKKIMDLGSDSTHTSKYSKDLEINTECVSAQTCKAGLQLQVTSETEESIGTPSPNVTLFIFLNREENTCRNRSCLRGKGLQR